VFFKQKILILLKYGHRVCNSIYICISKGIEVLTSPNPNSYSIPYDGPLKSAIEKWLPFSKDK